tara:strand:- start:438 stop:644 length:207 start_codon:yes stop_codon:yes gene_type:complete
MTDSPSNKVKFLLRVEDDILSTLRGLAKANGMSLSQLMRDILGAYVNRLTETPSPSPTATKKEKQWWN